MLIPPRQHEERGMKRPLYIKLANNPLADAINEAKVDDDMEKYTLIKQLLEPLLNNASADNEEFQKKFHSDIDDSVIRLLIRIQNKEFTEEDMREVFQYLRSGVVPQSVEEEKKLDPLPGMRTGFRSMMHHIFHWKEIREKEEQQRLKQQKNKKRIQAVNEQIQNQFQGDLDRVDKYINDIITTDIKKELTQLNIQEHNYEYKKMSLGYDTTIDFGNKNSCIIFLINYVKYKLFENIKYKLFDEDYMTIPEDIYHKVIQKYPIQNGAPSQDIIQNDLIEALREIYFTESLDAYIKQGFQKQGPYYSRMVIDHHSYSNDYSWEADITEEITTPIIWNYIIEQIFLFIVQIVPRRMGYDIDNLKKEYDTQVLENAKQNKKNKMRSFLNS